MAGLLSLTAVAYLLIDRLDESLHDCLLVLLNSCLSLVVTTNCIHRSEDNVGSSGSCGSSRGSQRQLQQQLQKLQQRLQQQLQQKL